MGQTSDKHNQVALISLTVPVFPLLYHLVVTYSLSHCTVCVKVSKHPLVSESDISGLALLLFYIYLIYCLTISSIAL